MTHCRRGCTDAEPTARDPSLNHEASMSAPPSATLLQTLRTLGVPIDQRCARRGPGPGSRRWLLTLRDGEVAHRIVLLGPPALCGSSDACDILVDDPRVDPVHLQIAPHQDGAVFRAGGARGFDCHGMHQRAAADVGWGVPVFIDELLMLTVDPWIDDA
jgi:hypothetical protein